jgi:hypothetical protein
MGNLTREECLPMIQAIVETVRDAGRAPVGILYAALLGRASLPAFEGMISVAVGTGLVKRTGHELVWVG